MINQLLLWTALIPIFGGLGLWFMLRKGDYTNAIFAGVGSAVLGVLILAGAFYGSSAVATSDVEIWNGQVIGKNRKHDEYQRSYDCNCKNVQTCSGSGKNRTCSTRSVCDTCYEDRYTVKWTIDSTVGKFTVQELDESSRRVYLSPDPQLYAQTNVGDPASRRNTYTNYIQAVPESLFATPPASLQARFAGLIPAYPDQIYDLFKNNHFLSPGFAVSDGVQWDRDIAMMLRELGPRKQVNAIVVIAKTDDPQYADALRYAWEGANKNDVVLVIGSKQWPQISFVRVISWTKNELFKIQLTNSVKNLGIIQREPIMDELQAQISKNFERRRMREFEYLKNEIDPPTWLIVTMLALILAAQGGAMFYIHRQAAQPKGRRRYR